MDSLARSHSLIDASWNNEAVGRELVVARCDPTAVLDPIEEPLDQISGVVQVAAEAD